ncbi:MAG: Eco57I restriction-modification methylase domain-containing protein [Desulfomicrobium sp.]|uniref:Eco57I restriction-modification methylase domain-containing protein n=1 Tax=Hoeflea sp. TaxID=1940281 RepID=UPI0025C2A533|nr:Eco57I restriction-modification methylase domain-containing protein [Hoeflea sp.]MBV1711576.1 Eco57I restriction-modification methylase domain-containing protein [Desulfomicrobium sp.]MBV1782300.1 Eco57I restriction-modification methylase domain-containing protein [Hoeflea sp.]
MSERAGFTLRGRNPDVLTCIANLSNDEVFTSPEFANRMLDTLAKSWAASNGGANIWADSSVKFLDPFTKSGVFLREITTRLLVGLVAEIPDLQARVDHILTRQVFGIGITRLTSLLARRSLYCSKHANGEHSVAGAFASDEGNIWFERIEHSWKENKCEFCGAPRALFDRETGLENHAYAFIHTGDIKTRMGELFGGDMQFDVIIGNPPYQMTGGGGGTNDSSIYHLFVEQAFNLEPRFVCMVIPSRWMAGGRGMEDFRTKMLSSEKLVELVDFPVSKDVFPGVEVKGGISYFLWEKAHTGRTNVTTIRGEEVIGPVARDLYEFDVFVRDTRAVDILHKVQATAAPSIIDILTADTPFGIATNFDGFSDNGKPGSVALHMVRKGKRSVVYLQRNDIRKNAHLIDRWKVLTPEAGSDGGQKIPDVVLGKPLIAAPGSVCTQSFLAFWVTSEAEAKSLQSYLSTKFFRFLVSLRKITQHALRSTYTWVPQQSWSRTWTDAMLYEKYGLSQDQIDYIEAVIKPMNLGTAGGDE